jgi:hypothetical protein
MSRNSRPFDLDAAYVCPHCGQRVDTVPDFGGGFDTTYIEDCPLCCRPNRIQVFVLPEDAGLRIEVSPDI